jgi:hypothetical protein
MNKEIEEMRALQRQKDQLSEYAKVLGKQAEDRGLCFILGICDPKTGAFAAMLQAPGHYLSAMTNEIVAGTHRSLLRENSRLRQRLKEIEPTWESE